MWKWFQGRNNCKAMSHGYTSDKEDTDISISTRVIVSPGGTEMTRLCCTFGRSSSDDHSIDDATVAGPPSLGVSAGSNMSISTGSPPSSVTRALILSAHLGAIKEIPVPERRVSSYQPARLRRVLANVPMNEKVAVAVVSVANIWNPPASKSLATSFRVQAPAGVYTISGLSSSTRTWRWATTRTSQSCRSSRDLGSSMGRLKSSAGEEVEANVHVLDSQEHEELRGAVHK